jgi:hypothetical protein
VLKGPSKNAHQNPLSLLIIEILVPASLIACGPADALTLDNETVGWNEDHVVIFNNCGNIPRRLGRRQDDFTSYTRVTSIKA